MTPCPLSQVGVVTGLGFGLMYLPAMDIIEIYFSENLGLATGLAAAGSGVGQFVMAPVVHHLSDWLGLHGTLLGMGGMVCTASIFALLYKMPKQEEADDEGIANPGYDGAEQASGGKNEGAERKDSCGISVDEKELLLNKEDAGCWAKLKRMRIFFILQSPTMILLLISHFLMHLGIFAAFSFTADRAISFGITPHHTSLLLSGMGISNCVGRIAFGKLLDLFRTRIFALTTAILIINALSVLLSDFFPTFIGQAVYCAIFGGLVITWSWGW